jgi:anti-sigma B factor antagonist
VAGDVNLVVDLLKVDFIESTGLGALIGGRRRAHALKGSLSLVCTEDQMLKIFRITGLDKVFAIHDTVEQATAQPPAPAVGHPAG